MLDDRRSHILQVLVEEYIRTGEPVSSQTILDRSGLSVSSATVRNDLSKLESYGFVVQPHTSAGRVPTQAGYRFYVDHCSPAQLRSATKARIEGFFTDMHSEVSRLLKDTSGLLSDLAHYPAIVMGPGFGSETVLGVHLVPVAPTVLLVVTVGQSGRVSQEVVRVQHAPTTGELVDAEAMLEQLFVGKTISAAQADVPGSMQQDVPDHVAGLVSVVATSLTDIESSTSELYIGGTSQLTSLWADLAHVQAILGLLERESDMRHIIGEAPDGTSVRFGSEINVDDVDLAVVATSYEAGGSATGRVGVLGPTRMDYRRTIRIVEQVGEGLEDRLGH
jgi:heat-inducible transcriptional repressor